MYYNYFCKECGIEKEVEHSIIQDPEVLCEYCDSIMKKKITGGIGEIYRGLGWPRKGTGTAPKVKKVTERVAYGPPLKER